MSFEPSPSSIRVDASRKAKTSDHHNRYASCESAGAGEL